MRAAIYTRISRDGDGDGLGVARQQADCRALCKARKFTVGAIFTDNDTGASTRTRRSKKRPEFEDMISRAEAGEFQAIIAYSNSRLTRRPLELERLITLHERTKVRIITCVSGEDDLSTADGRMVARIKAGVDAAESERLAERLTRKHLEMAQKGKIVGGTRPFGWKPGGKSVDLREAKLIRKAVASVLEGVPVTAITREWNERGYKTPRGGAWDARVLTRLLRSPRLAGWRVRLGEIATDELGQPVKGEHTPIIDQATYDRLVAALARPDNRVVKPRKGSARYLLTGIIRCGVCGNAMYGNRRDDARTKGPTHYYACRDDKIEPHVLGASGAAVDEFVSDHVKARLAAEKLATREPLPFAGDQRLAEIRDQIRELMTAYREGKLSGAVVFGTVNELESEAATISAERQRYEADLVANPSTVAVTAEDWPTLDLHRQRAVINRLVEAVVIQRSTKRSNKFDLDRVSVVWRGQS